MEDEEEGKGTEEKAGRAVIEKRRWRVNSKKGGASISRRWCSDWKKRQVKVILKKKAQQRIKKSKEERKRK